jgi:hypothetical protein
MRAVSEPNDASPKTKTRPRNLPKWVMPFVVTIAILTLLTVVLGILHELMMAASGAMP